MMLYKVYTAYFKEIDSLTIYNSGCPIILWCDGNEPAFSERAESLDLKRKCKKFEFVLINGVLNKWRVWCQASELCIVN